MFKHFHRSCNGVPDRETSFPECRRISDFQLHVKVGYWLEKISYTFALTVE